MLWRVLYDNPPPPPDIKIDTYALYGPCCNGSPTYRGVRHYHAQNLIAHFQFYWTVGQKSVHEDGPNGLLDGIHKKVGTPTWSNANDLIPQTHTPPMKTNIHEHTYLFGKYDNPSRRFSQAKGSMHWEACSCGIKTPHARLAKT